MREPRSYVIHSHMQRMQLQYRKEKMTCLLINECIDDYYADGTYDALWTKWIDASGDGEEAASAAEDTAE